MKIVFLGTSCSMPTVDRNLSAVALLYDGETLLFDCAEGTQRQMMKAKVSYMKINKIFLTHSHADHILGLPGMIATMSMHERDWPLTIYGPKGMQERIQKAIELALMKKSFEVEFKEVKEGIIVQEKNYTVSAVKLKHDIPCFGYIFEEKSKEGEFQKTKAEKLEIPEGPLWRKLQEGKEVEVKGKKIKPEQVMDYSKGRKGRKVSYIADTLMSGSYFDAIKDSDVLIHEATFDEKLRARAKETFHSTAKDAGFVAEKTNAKLLCLTHISARHKEAEKLENEARMEFGNVVVAKDLLEIDVPLRKGKVKA